MYACSLGPGPFRLRGAGGLRNPSRESRPGPEATVLSIAGQVDPRLTEFRPLYDSIDEPVRCCLPPPPCANMSHPPIGFANAHLLRKKVSGEPLAVAPVWRNHCSVTVR